jgi:hypothetical protein
LFLIDWTAFEYTVEMISFLPGNEKNARFGKMSQPGICSVASVKGYNRAFGKMKCTGYRNLLLSAFRDTDEGREIT